MMGVFPKKGLVRRGDQRVRSSGGEGWRTGQAQGVSTGDAQPGSSPEEDNMDNFFFLHLLLGANRE